MAKRTFVSADWKEPYDSHSWDKEVVDRIRKWRDDGRYGVDIICTDEVHKGVMEKPDCRRCDIKGECGKQINSSSVVIAVIGDKTATKTAGECDEASCSPAYSGQDKKTCKYSTSPAETTAEGGVAGGNKMSYLRHEITKAASAKKSIIVVFNSMLNQTGWIPSWYTTLKDNGSIKELWRGPFWKDKEHDKDCYPDIKGYLQ